MDKLKVHNDKRTDYVNDYYDYAYEEDEEGLDMMCGTHHDLRFCLRYNNDEIKFPKTYTDYLKNYDLQEYIKAMGLDVEKFWYLILYFYDLSSEKIKCYKIDAETPKKQYRNFIDTIDSNFELDAEGKLKWNHSIPVLKKDISIEIKIDGKKQSAKLTEPLAITYLSYLMDNFLHNSVEDGSCFASNATIIKGSEHYSESQSTRVYLAITYFKKFFEMKKAEINKGRYNKNLFIATILYFMRLIENRQIDEDFIKNTIKHYKKRKIDGTHLSSYR